MLKRREENDTYLTHIRIHRWSSKSLVKIEEMMYATVLAESSCYSFNFNWALSAPGMTIDMSQVYVALFPFLVYIFL